jgi:hypothetical protein
MIQKRRKLTEAAVESAAPGPSREEYSSTPYSDEKHRQWMQHLSNFILYDLGCIVHNYCFTPLCLSAPVDPTMFEYAFSHRAEFPAFNGKCWIHKEEVVMDHSPHGMFSEQMRIQVVEDGKCEIHTTRLINEHLSKPEQQILRPLLNGVHIPTRVLPVCNGPDNLSLAPLVQFGDTEKQVFADLSVLDNKLERARFRVMLWNEKKLVSVFEYPYGPIVSSFDFPTFVLDWPTGQPSGLLVVAVKQQLILLEVTKAHHLQPPSARVLFISNIPLQMNQVEMILLPNRAMKTIYVLIHQQQPAQPNTPPRQDVVMRWMFEDLDEAPKKEDVDLIS